MLNPRIIILSILCLAFTVKCSAEDSYLGFTFTNLDFREESYSKSLRFSNSLYPFHNSPERLLFKWTKRFLSNQNDCIQHINIKLDDMVFAEITFANCVASDKRAFLLLDLPNWPQALSVEASFLSGITGAKRFRMARFSHGGDEYNAFETSYKNLLLSNANTVYQDQIIGAEATADERWVTLKPDSNHVTMLAFYRSDSEV